MNKILEYQKIDGEILQINRKIRLSNPQKMLDQANSVANEARDKMKQLDKKAEELVKEYNVLRGIMLDNIKNIEILTKQSPEMQDKIGIKKQYENIKNVNNNLGIIESRLKSLTSAIDNVLKAFNVERKSIESSKEKRKVAQVELDEVIDKYKDELSELNNKLASVKKEVDPKLLDIYERLRDSKYPAFVEVIADNGENRCGGCKSLIATGRMDALKERGLIECENCHRVIYIKDKI